MTADQDWPRLGTYIRSRRNKLGMRSARELSEATYAISPKGISMRTLGKLETGQTRAYPSTLALLEIALQWKPGSADSVLGGGEPVETDTTENGGDRPADRSYLAILEAPGLTEGEKLAAIAAIEQQRARIAAAGFTRAQQQALRDAPPAYKTLMDRKRQADEDKADGASGRSA